DLSRPEAGGLDIGDGVLGDSALLVARIEDRRPIGEADIVALPVARRRVMDLEEEFEDLPVAGLGRVEQNLDRLGMRAVVAIGRRRHVAAGIADPRRDDAGQAPDELLHAPEAAAGEDRAFFAHLTSST